MDYQNRIADLMLRQIEAVCRIALAVPEDKRDWTPMGDGRSVMAQLEELATVHIHVIPILKTGDAPLITEDQKEQIRERKERLNTFDKLIEGAREGAKLAAEAIRGVPDSRLEDVVTLHSRGGIKRTMYEMVARPYWNLCYHEGQINYIQMLLGDTEMH